jgi:hypothetical protein
MAWTLPSLSEDSEESTIVNIVYYAVVRKLPVRVIISNLPSCPFPSLKYDNTPTLIIETHHLPRYGHQRRVYFATYDNGEVHSAVFELFMPVIS